MIRRLLAAALSLVALGALATTAGAKSGVFVSSAVENGDGTVTLPLYHATSGGQDVWLVVLDASSGASADRLGVNRSPKLANAGPDAVEHVDATLDDILAGRADLPATVDFTPVRHVVGDPLTGFPPAIALPAARGRPGAGGARARRGARARAGGGGGAGGRAARRGGRGAGRGAGEWGRRA